MKIDLPLETLLQVTDKYRDGFLAIEETVNDLSAQLAVVLQTLLDVRNDMARDLIKAVEEQYSASAKRETVAKIKAAARRKAQGDE